MIYIESRPAKYAVQSHGRRGRRWKFLWHRIRDEESGASIERVWQTISFAEAKAKLADMKVIHGRRNVRIVFSYTGYHDWKPTWRDRDAPKDSLLGDKS